MQENEIGKEVVDAAVKIHQLGAVLVSRSLGEGGSLFYNPLQAKEERFILQK